MKYIFSLLLTALFLTACGGSDKTLTTNPTIQSATGSWTASTTSSTTTATTTNPVQMTFTMSSTGTGGMMSFSNMQFVTQNPCFGSGSTMTATMTMGSGMMSSSTTMAMDLWSAANQTGNHLHMDMTMASDMRSATGTYTLTGVTSGCLSDSGTFTMTHQ